jgi:pantetheine-phosphate adenylyltransferase
MQTFAAVEYDIYTIDFVRKCSEYIVFKDNWKLTILVSIPYPTTFSSLQFILTMMYQQVVRVGWENKNPLLQVDIVLKEMCGPFEFRPDLEFSMDGKKMFNCESIDFERGTILKTDVVPADLKSDSSKYEVVALGGTFDHLHAGHKVLLTMAAYVAEKQLICGVSDLVGDRLTKKKGYQFMQPLQVRLSNVVSFLKKIKNNIEYQVVPIVDDFGPTQSEHKIDCIIGSFETKRGCEMGMIS